MAMANAEPPRRSSDFRGGLYRGVVLVEYRIQNIGEAVTSDEQTILKKR